MRKSKVNQKEFITIIKEAFSFDFRGYDAILNLISSYSYQSAERYREQGYIILADDAEEIADRLYDFLFNKGYYNWIKGTQLYNNRLYKNTI